MSAITPKAEVEPLVSLLFYFYIRLLNWYLFYNEYMSWATLSLSGQCLHNRESCTKAVERVVLSVAC